MKQNKKEEITVRSTQITRSQTHELTNEVSVGWIERCLYANTSAQRSRARTSAQRTRARTSAQQIRTRTSAQRPRARSYNDERTRVASRDFAQADFAMVVRCCQARDTIECSRGNGDTGLSVQLVGACAPNL